MDKFDLGTKTTARDETGEILRFSTVTKIGRTYFETADGAKWRSTSPGFAVRVPLATGAPTLRHYSVSDELELDARRAIESLTRWQAGPEGVNRRSVVRAARVLGAL